MPEKPYKESKLAKLGDFGRAFVNLLGNATGLWNTQLRSKLYSNNLSPAERHRLFQDFREQAGLENGFPGVTAFENYEQKRVKGLDDFSEVKAPDGTSIVAKLAGKPAAVDTINEALKGDKQGKLSKCKKEMQGIKDFIDDDQSKYNPFAVIEYAMREKSRSIEAIEEQHRKEIEKLEDALDTHKTDIKAAMATPPISDTQFDTLKAEMVSSLKAKHKEALDNFNKELTEPLEKLLEAQNRLGDARTEILYRLWNDPKSKAGKELRQIAAKKHPPPAIATINPDKINLEGVDIKDLSTILAYSGREIKNVKGDGSTFSMELPSHFWRFDYHMSSQGKEELDIRSLVLAVKACGHTGITMNIDNPDKNVAKKQAIKAYEECIKAGFDPKNIVVKFNGEELKPETISTSVQRAQGQREVIAAEEKSMRETDKGSRQFAKEIDAVREGVRAKREGPTAPSTGAGHTTP